MRMATWLTLDLMGRATTTSFSVVKLAVFIRLEMEHPCSSLSF